MNFKEEDFTKFNETPINLNEDPLFSIDNINENIWQIMEDWNSEEDEENELSYEELLADNFYENKVVGYLKEIMHRLFAMRQVAIMFGDANMEKLYDTAISSLNLCDRNIEKACHTILESSPM